MVVNSWEHAWHGALYGPVGLYRHSAPASHFATAAQGIPGSAAILAAALGTLADRFGCRRVIDLAAGRGELAAEIVRARKDLAVTAVDVLPRPVGLPAEVEWAQTPGGADLSGLPDARGALVFAQEWLDVVPCPVWQIDADGRPRVVLVDATGQETLGPPVAAGRTASGPGGVAPCCTTHERAAADLAWCETWWPLAGLPPGARVEVGRARDDAWAGLLRAAPEAVCVAVDYGHLRESRPPYGTLASFRAGRVVRPVPDGSCDLTAHVAVDSLRQHERHRQRDLLRSLGVSGALPELGLALSDPERYAAELARAGAAARLLDPGGLGGFHWVIALPGSSTPGS